MKFKVAWKRLLAELIGIAAGTAVMAIGLNLFLIPNQLAAGGISGLGIVLFHLFNVPVGLTIFLGNLPLFIMAYFLLGKKAISHSLVGMLLLSANTELFVFLPTFEGDLFLASIYGGAILGVGLWLAFNFRGSTGGTALASLLLNRVTGITLGQGLLGSDLIIIAIGGAAFGIEIAMYAAISLVVSSWVIDILQEGFSLVKTALIITEARDTITRRILEEIDRGVTHLSGRGGYTGEEKDMLFCVVTRPQVLHLKRIVYEEDPGAFMIVGNASETIGEGFKREEAELIQEK